MDLGLPKPTDALEHGRKPLCCIQGKPEHQPLKPLGFRETGKSSKPDGGGSGWRMEEELGTERERQRNTGNISRGVERA